MLPTPAIRAPRRHPLTGWWKALDNYTLWAFNPTSSRRRASGR